MGSGGGVVAVSAYMGGTRGLAVFSNAGDMLEMGVVRGVCGVCDMCMCLARGGGEVVDEWVTGLGLGLTNSGGTWGKWDMCLCFGCGDVGGVGGVGGEWVGGLLGSGRLGLCYVCMCCESGLSVLMTGPGICILC